MQSEPKQRSLIRLETASSQDCFCCSSFCCVLLCHLIKSVPVNIVEDDDDGGQSLLTGHYHYRHHLHYYRYLTCTFPLVCTLFGVQLGTAQRLMAHLVTRWIDEEGATKRESVGELHHKRLWTFRLCFCRLYTTGKERLPERVQVHFLLEWRSISQWLVMTLSSFSLSVLMLIHIFRSLFLFGWPAAALSLYCHYGGLPLINL